MSFRKDAEELNGSPEFIKVAYDKYGNPIGVRPVDGREVPDGDNGKSVPTVSAQTLHYDTKMIGQWLGVINQNMHTIREDIKLLENPNSKLMPILQETIAKNMEFTNRQIDLMNKELQNYKVLSNSIVEQLNLVNENFSLLRKEISDSNLVSRQIIAEVDLIKGEIRSSKNPSTEMINMLNAMNENFEILRSRVMEMSRETAEMNNKLNQKLSSVPSKQDFVDMTEKLSSVPTKQDFVAIEGKMSELPTKEDVSYLSLKLSDMASKEDLDMVISGFISKQEFYTATTELQDLINKNAIDKDELISELVEKIKSARRVKRRIRKKVAKKKIVRKIRKKRTRTMAKSTIRKFLLRKFGLNENERVLVVTDKKMEKIGNKVYETCRKINESTVFVVMENMKKSGAEPEDSVSEAMKNTDAIIGVTYYTLKKTNSLKQAVQLGARAFVMSKNLKFSLVKS